jgi:hypothetical protein
MALVESFWEATVGATLRQGEYLVNCSVPVMKEKPSFDRPEPSVVLKVYDLIIVTQSCDLEQGKAQFVALCPIFPLEVYEATNPELKGKGRWEQVRKGRVEGLYLLSSPSNPDNHREALVVDFGEIHGLPFDLLVDHAQGITPRWRLKPPFLEHFPKPSLASLCASVYPHQFQALNKQWRTHSLCHWLMRL